MHRRHGVDSKKYTATDVTASSFAIGNMEVFAEPGSEKFREITSGSRAASNHAQFSSELHPNDGSDFMVLEERRLPSS